MPSFLSACYLTDKSFVGGHITGKITELGNIGMPPVHQSVWVSVLVMAGSIFFIFAT